MVFRRQASHGIWCVILLPTILILTYSRSSSYSKDNLCILMCSLSLSASSLLVYYKVVFPVAVVNVSTHKKEGFFKYFMQCLFYDLFERNVSTVIRKTRKMSSAISPSLQPSTMKEARRLREYTARIRKSSASTSPFAQRLIPGEDRKRSFEQNVSGSLVEPIADESSSPRERKRSCLVDNNLKVSFISQITSPAHLLVPPVEELYHNKLETLFSRSNRRCLNVYATIISIIIAVFVWSLPGDYLCPYILLSISFI